MRKVGIFLSLAFFAVAFSPAAMPAGAQVLDAPVPTGGTDAPDLEGAAGGALEAVEEAVPAAAPVTDAVQDAVGQVTGTDPGPIVDPVDPGPGGGEGNSDPDPVDDARERSGDGTRRTVDTPARPAPVSVASGPAADPAPELPRTADLRRFVAKTPAADPEPATTFVESASSERAASAPVVEQVKKAASKMTFGLLQILALLLVVGMLGAEFLYGMRRISGGVLRA